MQKKLASKAAVICYGFGDLASQFVWTFVGTYLTVFYTEVVGIAPAAVAAILLGARIWDAFNDPMMGALAERTRSRFGRFRPYIAFGSPILAIFAVLTFTNPFEGSSTAGVIWAAVIYIIAGMVYTLTNIPYSALSGVMTEDANQRNQINTSRNIGMNAGMVIVNAVSAGLLLKFSAPGAEVADKSGYLWTAIIFSIIAVPLFLLVFFTSRENVEPVEHTKFSVKDTVMNLVKNKYLMVVTLAMFILMTAFMGRIAVAAFYVIHCTGDFTKIAMFMTIPSIGAIIGSIPVPWLAKRFGKRNVFAIATILSGIGLLVIYMADYTNWTQILIGCWIFGLSNVGMPLSLSMVADSVDYMEDKTGLRTDGTAYATYGLATKVGNALGGAVGLMIMTAFGYNPQAAPGTQTEEALRGINLTVNLIPAILFFLVAVVLFALWNKTDADFDAIRERLHAGGANVTPQTELDGGHLAAGSAAQSVADSITNATSSAEVPTRN